ncbi:hypothetical protein BCV70DRAFT_74548 [Testicularia cyperi]|uniref:DUF985 domain-containing protein n=1 Tax=Testicularia cyperi TaxID=1882483 RepID=A0A317XTU6_9BASI|nr:hypothetical protein BCV70DRAFT_74548 [Testicularia cyperi]
MSEVDKHLYPYPQSNKDPMKAFNLKSHPEGGYFALTWAMPEGVLSPFASDGEERQMASCIFHLLCHKSPGCPDRPPRDGSMIDASEPDVFRSWSSDVGVFHLNKSHLHHAGRSKYTLVSAKHPLGKGLVDERGKPLTKIVVMGDNLGDGAVRQLLVEGNWWKVSEFHRSTAKRWKRTSRWQPQGRFHL